MFSGFQPATVEAIWRSPFYLSICEGVGLIPTDLSDPRSLEHFPLLTRQSVADNAAAIVTSARDVYPVYSSGTTGKPMRVYRSKGDELRLWDLILASLSLQNLTVESDRRVTTVFLCALPDGLTQEYTLTRDLGPYSIDVRRTSITRSPHRSLELVCNHHHVLVSSPRGLAWLSHQGVIPNGLGCYSTATAVTQELWLSLHRHWKLSMLHTYSTSETGPLAWLCKSPDQVNQTYHGFVDVFFESDRATGGVIVTKLFPSIFPLIRYQTGDRAELSTDPCPCGFEGQSLRGLTGRKSA